MASPNKRQRAHGLAVTFRALARLLLAAAGFFLALLILEVASRKAPGLLRRGAVRSDTLMQALQSEEAKRLQTIYGRGQVSRSLEGERIFKIGVPNVEFHVFGLDFTSSVKYNSLGIRDREPDELGGFPRILLLGDSFIEGRGVAAGETISSFLEAELANRGRRHSVINAGIGGTGTTNQLHLLQYLEPYYRPQTVLPAVYLGNDIRSNSLTLDACLVGARTAFAGGTPPQRPRAVRGYYWKAKNEGGYQYVPPGSDLKDVLDASQHAALVQCGLSAAQCAAEESRQRARRLLTALGSFMEFSNVLKSLILNDVEIECEPRLGNIPVSLLAEIDKPSPQLEKAWDVTAYLLGALKAEVRRMGADLRVLALPSRIQVDPGKRSVTFRAYGVPPSAPQARPELHLGQILDSLGIPYLDLVTAARRQEGSASFYFPIDNHPNSSGNRFFALQIADWLAKP